MWVEGPVNRLASWPGSRSFLGAAARPGEDRDGAEGDKWEVGDLGYEPAV